MLFLDEACVHQLTKVLFYTQAVLIISVLSLSPTILFLLIWAPIHFIFPEFFFFFFWLHWVFVAAVRGYSGYSAWTSHCGTQTLGIQASVVVAHRFSCSVVCAVFPDQGLNPCPLHWQADS